MIPLSSSHIFKTILPSHCVCCSMLPSPSLSISSICSIHFVYYVYYSLCVYYVPFGSYLSMHCYLFCSSCFCWPSTIEAHGASNIKNMFFICVCFVYNCHFCLSFVSICFRWIFKRSCLCLFCLVFRRLKMCIMSMFSQTPKA